MTTSIEKPNCDRSTKATRTKAEDGETCDVCRATIPKGSTVYVVADGEASCCSLGCVAKVQL